MGSEEQALPCQPLRRRRHQNPLHRISGNDAYTRILEERENPQADIWYGGTWDPYIAAANEGLLYAYKDIKHAPYKSPNYGIGEPNWFGIYSGYIGFICDMEALEEAGVEPPANWEDLTKPEYSGMIVMATPAHRQRRDDRPILSSCMRGKA